MMGLVVSLFDLSLPDDWQNKYPKIEVQVWGSKVDALLKGLTVVIEKHLAD